VKLLRSRILWGLLLIVMGVLFLVESLGFLALGGAWSVLFFAAAIAFASVFFDDREAWWAIIPAMTLFGLGALIVLGTYLSPAYPELGPAVFLGSIGLSFWIIYFATHRRQWWAIIPGGVLLALAVSLLLEPFLVDDAFAGVFMLGMGLTFALVYLLPTREGRMGWALIPAAILGVIGVGLLLAAVGLPATALNLIWPLALIVIGGYLLLRSLRR
jgi:hypothetical protein